MGIKKGIKIKGKDRKSKHNGRHSLRDYQESENYVERKEKNTGYYQK
jgi:hypothetical protein